MTKRVVKPIKSVAQSISKTKAKAPKVSRIPVSLNRATVPDAFIADKILNAARQAGLGRKKKEATSASFSATTPPIKRLSRRDEAMQIVGAANMARVMELIRDEALKGDWERQKYLADLFYPKGKPDRYITRAVDEMIELNGLKGYQDNIALITSMAMKGDIDLDDSALLIGLLKEGKDFIATNTVIEIEERLKTLNKLAPTRK